MSKKDPGKSFEDIQKQLQNMLRNLNTNASFVNLESNFSEQKEQVPPSNASDGLEPIREFRLKPKNVKEYLDRYVISQGEAKRVLSVAICDHYNHINRCVENPERKEKDYVKQNIILLGPTGVGKTYLVRCLAKLVGVPFVKADATKFSETGYVGHDVEDLVRDLVKLANGNTELAQYGIIYLDEIDKIAGKATSGHKDVSGRGVQINLLKLMEDTEVSLQSQHDLAGQMEAMMDVMNKNKEKRQRSINTRHILFIVSGAFSNLSAVIRKRIKGSQIGFDRSVSDKHEEEQSYFELANTKDFVDEGFEPEFIGRLPVRVSCNTLSVKDLKKILLESEGSILEQYKDDFSGYDIDFSITPEAVQEIAERASREKTGARGLMTVLERSLREYKFELPSTSIDSLQLSKEMMNDPKKWLDKLLKNHTSKHLDTVQQQVQSFCEEFKQKHELELVFDNSGLQYLEKIARGKKSIKTHCEELLHDYEFGLRLIARNTGKTSFLISEKVLQSPDESISHWLIDSYNNKG